ncbi:MAG: class II aldolase/adducin family protein [Anaerolineae bacterium]|jgi:L-fuculose-phosphate aldolase|nr:class II aldolase/adducin family protein [Anaerolineae bacterium]
MSLTREQMLREQICLVGQQLHRFELIDGSAGNISARLDAERILITPSGLAKGFLQPEQLLLLGMDGQRLADTPATAALKPSSETPMHLEAYRQRPDIGGVVHAHPLYAVALTIAGINLQRYTIPEAIILLGDVPYAPYATPAGDEDRLAISDLITQHDALMLSFHGSLTVGKDVWEAYLLLETLEHTARLTYLVHQLGGGMSLPEDRIHQLLALRRSLGLMRDRP